MKLFLAAGVILWPATYSIAQTPPPAASAPPQPTRSIDLVAHDKKGKLPADLKPADIQILDNGAPVTVSGVRLVNGGGEHFVTLVFDKLDGPPAKAARDAANEILKAAPKDFSIAVFVIDGRLRLLQQFTSGRNTLKSAIAAVTGTGKGGYNELSQSAENEVMASARSGPLTGTPGAEQTPEQSTLDALQESQRIVQDQHANPALAGLLALARKQAALNGRKAIVYFSRGPQIDSAGRSMLASIITAANRAKVSIYAIDAKALDSKTSVGIIAGTELSTANSAGIANAPSVSEPAPQTADAAPVTSEAGPLGELAENTCGEYIAAFGDSRKPIGRMIADLATYYEASFAPSDAAGAGRSHRIAVKSLTPGLSIRSRSSYDALPTGTLAASLPFEAPLVAALAQANAPVDIDFNAHVFRLGVSDEGAIEEVVVETPLKAIEIREDPNTRMFSAHLCVLTRIRDQYGRIIEKFSEDIQRNGAIEAEEQARAEAVTFQRHFILRPGQYTIESVVQDCNAGKIGTHRAAFEVRSTVRHPSLSDLAVVRRMDPFHGDPDLEEPFRYAKARVVPNVAGVIESKEKALSFFFMVHPDPGAAEKPKLAMEIRKTGELVEHVPLEVTSDEDHGAIGYLASIAAGKLGPGSYEIFAIVNQGKYSAQGTAMFTVAGSGGAPEVQPAATETLVINPAGNAPANISEPEPPETPRVREPLKISPAAVSLPPPPPDTLTAILKGATERATGYSRALPDFLCLEITRRSVDAAGAGRFRRQDTITELVRYHDQFEKRLIVHVNGAPSDASRENLKGTMTLGEFGSLLDAVFEPDAKAEFHWKETDTLGSAAMQVFAYRVPKEHSRFRLVRTNVFAVNTAYHGLVYIDAATYGVRRLTLESDDVPADIHERAEITIDYDYVAIGDHDYLMPATGAMKLTRGKTVELNEMEFRDYRKYGAETSIHFDSPKP